MKHNINFLFSLFFLINLSPSSFAQEFKEYVISPTGGSLDGNSISIDYTFGEWTNLNMNNSSGEISNGFQNDNYLVSSVYDYLPGEILFSAFPNPTSDYLTISIKNKTIDISYIKLSDLQGKVVFEENWQTGQLHHQVSLHRLSKQIYFINLFNENHKTLKTIKLIKQ